jgi:hypothetical protein
MTGTTMLIYLDDPGSVYQPHGYVVEYGDSITGDSGSGSSAFDAAGATLYAPCELSLGEPSFATVLLTVSPA